MKPLRKGTRKTLEATMKEQIEGIERFDSPAKGRGLRVTRPFRVGELLFSCPPYASVLSVKERGNYCEACFARKQGLAKCGKCRKAFYCNVSCQKGDWPMHKLECSGIIAYGPKWCPAEIVRLVARILGKKKAQKERSASEKLMQIGEMQSHVKDLGSERKSNNESDIASLHHFYSKHLEFPDHQDLLSLLSQVGCNGFTVEDEELSHMGTSVYPDVALINHSCLPTVIVTYKGVAAEVRAVQALKPGDEVLISYIDLLYPTEDRNERLRDCYYFTCDCKECKTKSKDKAKLKVRKRSEPIAPDVISNMVSYAKKMTVQFRAAKSEKTPSDMLEMCERSLDKMGTVFDDSNVYMLHMMYQAMGVCLYMGDWNGAINYGEKIAKPYSELYPPYSLNVSSIYLKLARLYVGMEKPLTAMTGFKKARSIMEVAHGKDHPYVEELTKEMEKL